MLMPTMMLRTERFMWKILLSSDVYAFTTIGGFASNDRLNSLLTEKSGVLQVEWFPPEEGSGTADLFVIVENGNGGSAIWTGEGEVK